MMEIPFPMNDAGMPTTGTILHVEHGAAIVRWPERSGRLWVAIGNRIYGRDEQLPLGEGPLARAFVRRCMEKNFGLPIHWPAVAIEFVYPPNEESGEPEIQRAGRHSILA